LRNPSATLGRDAIFQHFPGYLGAGRGEWRTTPVSTIQSGDWKLLEFLEDGRLELYNLKDDLGEKTNLAARMPDKAQELRARLLAWRAEVKAPMPGKNEVKQSGDKPKKKKAG
jgi:arylsulfatase A-like enzyme